MVEVANSMEMGEWYPYTHTISARHTATFPALLSEVDLPAFLIAQKPLLSFQGMLYYYSLAWQGKRKKALR